MSKGRIIKNCEIALFCMPVLGRISKGKDDDGGGEKGPLHAQQRTETIEREAYETGFAAGEKNGLELGERKAAVLLEKLEAIITEMQVLKDGLIKELEPQITGLAAAIARKIILEELTVKPEAIVRIVKEAIRKIERTGTITIKISPALYDLFMRMKPELLELYPEIVYDVDPSASATGPVVIGDREEVLTDIDDQLKNIIECLETDNVAY